ncbi:sugar transferase [bacterium]|nr:sugar transferase [bacterium]
MKKIKDSSQINNFHALISALLLTADIGCLFLSMALAYAIRFKTTLFTDLPYHLMTLEPAQFFPGELGGPISHEKIYVLTAFIIVPLWLFLFKYYGLYREKRSADRIENWLLISKTITIGTLVLLVASFFIRAFIYSRIVVLIFWILNIVLTTTARVIIRNYEAQLRKKGYDIRKVILYGHSPIGDVLYNDITSIPNLGYRFIGWVDDDPPREREILGSFRELPQLVKHHSPLDVFVVDPNIPRARIMEAISECEGLHARFKIVSNLFDMMTSKNIETISGFPVLEFGEGEFSPWKCKFKRIFDITLSIFALIILSPLFLAIMLLIRITGNGPIIFKQTRIGQAGVSFTIYKFPSMYPDTDPYLPSPTSLKDSRITPLGRFLRRTSLDELPQFINVLKGEMSIVGPRPEMPFLVAQQTSWQRKRMQVRPGMTGVWQTMGRSDLPLQDHLEFDLYYLRNQSLFYDIQIILRTILVVIFGKGAY